MRCLAFFLLFTFSLTAEQELVALKGFTPETYATKWTIGYGVWKVEEGVLSGRELKESNHSAGTGVNHPCSNGTISFEFTLAKAEFVQLVIDELKGKKDHRFKFRVYSNGDVKLNAGSKRNKTLRPMGPLVSLSNFNKDVWHSLKVVYKGKGIKAYIDGELVKDVTAPKDFARPKNRMSLNVKGFAKFRNFLYSPSH